MSNVRRLDDPGDGSGCLLTLPLSDFPRRGGGGDGGASASANDGAPRPDIDDDEEDDELVLLRLPGGPSGLNLSDLAGPGVRAHILGETSEADVGSSGGAAGGVVPAPPPRSSGDGGSIEPVAARLILTSDTGGRTLELTRVETSNTYVVVPPLDPDAGSSKRQKVDGGGEDGRRDEMASMPARSVGKVPGEDAPSCFFLDPTSLPRGHFADRLRAALGRFRYDPFAPPDSGEVFGYTVRELAHVCRTSVPEMEEAVGGRTAGAEDAMAAPSHPGGRGGDGARRYCHLSEEGRQTVLLATVAALLETDLELAWEGGGGGDTGGTDVAALMGEVRSHWHSLEGDDGDRGDAPGGGDESSRPSGSGSQSQSQFGERSQVPAGGGGGPSAGLPDEVVWHCLRPLLRRGGAGGSGDGDAIPPSARLVPDEVARAAAHAAFLRGTPTALSGGDDGATSWRSESELLEAWSGRLPSMTRGYEPRTSLLGGIAVSDSGRWRYLPEAALPLDAGRRLGAMFAARRVWTLSETVPYLARFAGGGDGEGGVEEGVRGILEEHAKEVRQRSEGKRTERYVAKS